MNCLNSHTTKKMSLALNLSLRRRLANLNFHRINSCFNVHIFRNSKMAADASMLFPQYSFAREKFELLYLLDGLKSSLAQHHR